MTDAIRAHARGSAARGTPADRIARAETAMAEIGRIDDTAEFSEQAAILNMNESLHMLIMSFEPSESR